MKAERIIEKTATLVIGVVLGGAIGYRMKPTPAPLLEEPSVMDRVVIASPTPTGDESSDLEDMRRQIGELHRQIAELERRSKEEAQEEGVFQVAEEPISGREPGDWRERMKGEDLVRYTAMTNYFEQMRTHRRERAQDKVDFFSLIDTSRMSAEDRAQTENLRSLIVKRESIEENFADKSITEEERAQIADELGQTMRSIYETNGVVREALFKQTLEMLGFSGDDVAEIAATLDTIVDMTESHDFQLRGPTVIKAPDGPG